MTSGIDAAPAVLGLRPNEDLEFLLENAGYPITPDHVLYSNPIRRDLINSAFLNWVTSESVEEASLFGNILVLANTIEARSQDRDDKLLARSIRRFLWTSPERPTLMHVTPLVMEALDDDYVAAEYLDRMLATNSPTDGWTVVTEEDHEVRYQWALRFMGHPVIKKILHQVDFGKTQ